MAPELKREQKDGPGDPPPPLAAFAALCASANKAAQGDERPHGAAPHFGAPSVFGSLGGDGASSAFHGASTVYAGAYCLLCR